MKRSSSANWEKIFKAEDPKAAARQFVDSAPVGRHDAIYVIENSAWGGGELHSFMAADVGDRADWALEPQAATRLAEDDARRMDSLVLTTVNRIEGYRVIQTLEIVTAECVFGMNVFRDFFSAMTDFFGGRSEATQTVLRDARRTCLRELRREALVLGANAVIGVDLNYSEFSGQGKSMLLLIAAGTAVVIEPVSSASNQESPGAMDTHI